MSLLVSLCIICLFISTCNAQETPFDQNYFSLWGGDHVTVLDQGREVQIKIDKDHGGGGIESKQSYNNGIFIQKMKMPKNASGIVTTSYLTSLVDGTEGPHYELDFELLGNGPPYILSTNVFADDDGHREQQFKLWFDPTSDFHEYKITWNQYQIVFFVDEIPIRVLKNYMKIGVKYPTQPMRAHSSLWDAPAWLGNVNWSLGPFYAHFRGFTINDCGNNNANCESQLNPQQQKMYQDIRRSSMIANYCTNKGSTIWSRRTRLSPLLVLELSVLVPIFSLLSILVLP